jgi:hypothetical protein
MPRQPDTRHPFGQFGPPEVPSGTLHQRGYAYVHRFPDHWGKKNQLKKLLPSAAFISAAETSATKGELETLLDFLDGMYALCPRGPCRPDNPWWPR